MKDCPPSQLVAEVERQGGSISAGYRELDVNLPPDITNESWLKLIKQNKAELIAYLTPRIIDQEDHLSHVAWSNKQEDLTNA